MLGVFDSGVGGLTILRRLRARLPAHDFVYLADQAHVPYGDRGDAELLALIRQNVAFLEEAGADAIVVGCNTSCAVAADAGWPATSIPILDLIVSAAGAVARSGARRVGVLATSATVRTRAYTRAIRALVPDARVEEVAAPALVPLVEAGASQAEKLAAVAAACAAFPDDLETLVLACSHFPVLEPAFTELYGARVPRIDPALEHAEEATALVAARALPPGSGRVRYMTTGDAETFARQLRTLVGEARPEVVGLAKSSRIA